jgi:hypothetical protein
VEALNQRPVHNRAAAAAAVVVLKPPPLDNRAEVLNQRPVHRDKAAAAADAVAVNRCTLPRQAPGTCARFFITGAGIWACCVAKRKTI